MNTKNFRNYFPVLLVALLLIIPLGFITAHLAFRLDTDYNVILPIAQFTIMAFRHPFPYLTWNPLVGLGVPVLGDPTSFVLSPWYMPVFLTFGADAGIRVMIALAIVVSGYAMWRFLISQQVDRRIAIWGAILYETSGALAAIVADGHVEKIASYAVTPFAFLCVWRSRMRVVHRIALGLLFACMYLSTDLYTPWFLSIFLASIEIYNLVTKQKSIREVAKDYFFIYGSFIAFSLPKLIPFIRDVVPYLDRRSVIDPFMGSIHAVFLPLSYIVPWQVTFYDRPTLQRILQFRYNWYEYYAFITPISFLLLLRLKGVFGKIQVRWVLVLTLVSALYLSLKFPYSPFYWLYHFFPITQIFRVPQRVAVPLLVPIIVLLSYSASDWILDKKKSTYVLWFILTCSVVWTYLIMFSTIKSTFVAPRVDEQYVAQELRHRDPGNFYVVNFACCMQPSLLEQSIPMLNYYYGWVPSYAPRFTHEPDGALDFKKLTYIRPSYIIAPKKESFVGFGYLPYFDRGSIQVWKTETPTIFPSL